MKHRAYPAFFLAGMILVCCKTTGNVSPSPTPSPSPSPGVAAIAPSPTPEPSFDPQTVTPEEKQEAMEDISLLIQMLNAITQRKDFDSWKVYLSDDFIKKFSSQETLDRLNEVPILRRQEIVLRSLRDYFIFVVYPSHQNDRVDDIEFIGHNRVRAITISKKGERLVLWNLEKIESRWKIGIGR